MKQLLLHNARLNHANNSSSSHSLVILPPGTARNNAKNGDFGGDNFTASSKDSKNHYVLLLLKEALRNVAPEAMVEAYLSHTFDFKPIGNYDYIDHQSVYQLPLSWDERFYNEEFFTAFKEFFLRPDVVILGGDDNSEEDHPLAGKFSFKLNMPQDESHSKWVARYDKTGNFWTLFERTLGSKYRMSFVEPDVVVNPFKSEAPELVDIKITDACPFGCPYCYMGSTPNGKVGDFKAIKNSTLLTTIKKLSNVKAVQFKKKWNKQTLTDTSTVIKGGDNFLKCLEQLINIENDPYLSSLYEHIMLGSHDISDKDVIFF